MTQPIVRDGTSQQARVTPALEEGFIHVDEMEFEDLIERAVLFFEPRIDLNNVEVEVEDVYRGLIRIQLNYTINITNSRSNMVYPFYFQEGTSPPVT